MTTAETAGPDRPGDPFSGARRLLPHHDFVPFHETELPKRIASHGHLIGRDLDGVGALCFATPEGDAFTYHPAPGRIDVAPGDDPAATRLELGRQAFSDFVNEILTASGLAATQQLQFARGGIEDLQRWEPALRVLFQGRPIWTPDAARELVDEHGQTLNLQRCFRPSDSDAEMAAFLERAGFLHVRGVFPADEIAALAAELEKVRASLEPGTGNAWWSTTRSGEQVVTRINYLDRGSEALRLACFDPRVQRFGRLLGNDFRVCDDRLDGPMAFIKNSQVVQGLGDLNWHQDDGLGGHPIMCPLMQVGVQLDPANAENGQLYVLAGSHRHTNHPMSWGEESGKPVVRIVTEPGDVTVHFGDIFHTTPPPTGENAGRRVLYFKFAMPKTFEAIAAGTHYNDLLFNPDAGGRVAVRSDTWSEDDTQEGFQSASLDD